MFLPILSPDCKVWLGSYSKGWKTRLPRLKISWSSMGSQEKLLAIHDPKAIFPPLVLGKDNDPITKSMTAV